tara:strand:+ start:60 stop:248 length:189 start_codon:yes stop_codon:yes gene_type:complete
MNAINIIPFHRLLIWAVAILGAVLFYTDGARASFDCANPPADVTYDPDAAYLFDQQCGPDAF